MTTRSATAIITEIRDGQAVIELSEAIKTAIAAVGVWGTSGITSWERDRLDEWKRRTFLSEKQERILAEIERKAGVRKSDDG